jgi:steroid delta-isomerase-like uncharacterized protein
MVACGGEETPPPQSPQPPPAVSVNSAMPAPADTTATPAEAPKPSLAELEISGTKAAFDALNAHDADKLVSLLTDDAVIKMAGMPDVTGKDTVKAMHQAQWAAFPDAKYAWSRMWQSNDVAVVEHAWTGTNTGDFMGMKATNKPVGVMGLTISWFTPDGHVKEMHHYVDHGSVAMQLGVPKAKGRPLVGLPTSTEIHKAGGSADEQKNVDFVKGLDAAMNKKDITTFLGALTDDSEYVENTMASTSKGKKDAEKWFKMFSKAFPDMNTTSSNVWGVEDFVIHESTMTGTQKGPLGGPGGAIPATGKSVTLHSAEIQQIKDGKLVKGWGYSNGAELAMQLGLMKPPGQANPAATKTGASKTAPAPTK